MDWHKKKKAAGNVSRFTRIAILVAGAYWLYARYMPETQIRQNQVTYTKSDPLPSQKVSLIPDTVKRREDTLKAMMREGDAKPAIAVSVSSSAAQPDSSVLLPAVVYRQDPSHMHAIRKESRVAALHGPSALFSRVCNVAIGKTVPVNVVWEGEDGKAAAFKLITIKVDDIADRKARFTIEDPFNVLLFSQTGYAADDKIIIHDEKHNLSISVAEVTANAAVVNIVSRLDESIVSRLQKAE